MIQKLEISAARTAIPRYTICIAYLQAIAMLLFGHPQPCPFHCAVERTEGVI